MPYDKITDPNEVRVAIPVRVAWRAREELTAIAHDRHTNVNSIICEAIEAYTGIVTR
jgi:hypothetical protein